MKCCYFPKILATYVSKPSLDVRVLLLVIQLNRRRIPRPRQSQPRRTRQTSPAPYNSPTAATLRPSRTTSLGPAACPAVRPSTHRPSVSVPVRVVPATRVMACIHKTHVPSVELPVCGNKSRNYSP